MGCEEWAEMSSACALYESESAEDAVRSADENKTLRTVNEELKRLVSQKTDTRASKRAGVRV